MNTQRLDPVDAARCRNDLAKLNGNYAICFDWMHDTLGYDCSAHQLSATLKRNGYAWAPGERGMRKWLNEIRPVLNHHRRVGTTTRNDG